jgi:hypothetical protein
MYVSLSVNRPAEIESHTIAWMGLNVSLTLGAEMHTSSNFSIFCFEESRLQGNTYILNTTSGPWTTFTSVLQNPTSLQSRP